VSGEIERTASVEYVMFYKNIDEKEQHKSAAVYTGLMKFIGSLGGKKETLSLWITARLKMVRRHRYCALSRDPARAVCGAFRGTDCIPHIPAGRTSNWT
jgi:hypothetical protein